MKGMWDGIPSIRVQSVPSVLVCSALLGVMPLTHSSAERMHCDLLDWMVHILGLRGLLAVNSKLVLFAGGLLAKRLIREYVSDALHQRCQAIDTGAYIQCGPSSVCD